MAEYELTDEQVKTYGLMNQSSRLNFERKSYQSKMEKLFEIIKNKCDPPEVIEAYKISEVNIPIPYEAIIGERENKKGEKKACYVSVYGKYAGAIKKGERPPTLLCYLPVGDYFDYDPVKKDFIYKYEYVEIRDTKLKVVKRN